MKQKQTQSIKQTLTLTQQQHQALRILALSTEELEQETQSLLAQNPFLELVENSESSLNLEQFVTFSTHTSTSSTPLLQIAQPQEAIALPNASPYSNDLDFYAESHLKQATLSAYLHEQASFLKLSRVNENALHWLIDCLDEHGFLSDDLEKLLPVFHAHISTFFNTKQLTIDRSKEIIEQTYFYLINLEPHGVGAQNTLHSLQLQARLKQTENLQIHTTDDYKILEHLLNLDLPQSPLAYFAQKKWGFLAKMSGYTVQTVQTAFKTLQTLNPRPYAAFDTQTANTIRPEIIIQRQTQPSAHTPNNGLNENLSFSIHFPTFIWEHVRLSPSLDNFVREKHSASNTSNETPDSTESLVSYKKNAHAYLSFVQQRQQTLSRVVYAIFEHQKEFLIHGCMAIKPLKLRTLSHALNLHESTISRALHGKYIQTPHGTFALKYFFPSSIAPATNASLTGNKKHSFELQSENGLINTHFPQPSPLLHNVSQTAAIQCLAQIIKQEDKSEPLSDAQLQNLLKSYGIVCARRTIAKYRQSLGILNSTLRKV